MMIGSGVLMEGMAPSLKRTAKAPENGDFQVRFREGTLF